MSRSDRDDILLYLNLDMIASPNAGYFVLGGEGKTSAKHGPRGSAQVACVLVEQLAATGVVARTTTFDRESDYAAFIDAGIPVRRRLVRGQEEQEREAGPALGRTGRRTLRPELPHPPGSA